LSEKDIFLLFVAWLDEHLCTLDFQDTNNYTRVINSWCHCLLTRGFTRDFVSAGIQEWKISQGEIAPITARAFRMVEVVVSRSLSAAQAHQAASAESSAPVNLSVGDHAAEPRTAQNQEHNLHKDLGHFHPDRLLQLEATQDSSDNTKQPSCLESSLRDAGCSKREKSFLTGANACVLQGKAGAPREAEVKSQTGTAKKRKTPQQTQSTKAPHQQKMSSSGKKEKPPPKYICNRCGVKGKATSSQLEMDKQRRNKADRSI
jgi:hypothetical protein